MLEIILNNFTKFADRNAFCIKDRFYSYTEFNSIVNKIKNLLLNIPEFTTNKIIGVITDDSIETYASIFGIWFARGTFVPINPRNPKDRNNEIIKQTQIQIILLSNSDYSDIIDLNGLNVFKTSRLEYISLPLQLPELYDDDIMYILFTSGSTGVPKGVPICRKNIDSFIESFLNTGCKIDEQDRFLQFFDFTFDVSVQLYVLPLYLGACVYTVPQDKLKYLSTIKILKQYKITFSNIVPSALRLIQPYFDQLNLPAMRYSLFAGEELPAELISGWQNCVPNASIENHYGPTEATILCLYYKWSKSESSIKQYNGIVCIGKPYKSCRIIIVDENLNDVKPGIKGELCLSGEQVTKGYWGNDKLNQNSFFTRQIEGKIVSYYRTGDLVFADKEYDIMFCGRIDNQVQVQGFRVELGEIEYHARSIIKDRNIVVLALRNKPGTLKIYLFIEDEPLDKDLIYNYLKEKIPYYMLPDEIVFQQQFPLTISGKIDRKKLTESIKFSDENKS